MEKYTSGAIANICCSMLRVGTTDRDRLENTVNVLYRLNDNLRTQIIETANGTKQVVLDYTKQNFEVVYFKSKKEFSLYARNEAQQPIDLYGSLCNIKIVFVGNCYGLLVKLHHIVGDAWTMSLLAKQFLDVLEGGMPLAYSYMDYLKSEEKYIKSKRYQKDKQFFLEQFRKCDEVVYLSDKQDTSYHAARKAYTLSKELTAQIIALADNHHSSIFSVMVTLLGTYFSRIKMNLEYFYLGTPILNRVGIKEQNTAGMYINTIPLLITINSEKTFYENLSITTDIIMSSLRHQRYNYEDLLYTLRAEYNLPVEKLYDVTLSYQNAKIEEENYKTEWYSSGMQIESLQIHIDDRDGEGVLTVTYDYRTDKFTEKEIERIHEHLYNLFTDIVKDNNKRICELEILSTDEKNKLLYEFNNTRADYPKNICVHQLFEEQVSKTPDKTAVIACDQTLTYNELNKLSNCIANALIEKGIRNGDIVAFALPRMSYLIATIIGILKSGAAYLPIDSDYPKNRIEYIVKDSGAKLLITQEIINQLLCNKKAENPVIDITSDSLCYCIYTSGSTGQPKGTLIKHRNIINNIFWRRTQYQMHNNRIILITNVTSDTFMEDIYYALFSDNELYIVNNNHNFNEINVAAVSDSAIMTTPTVFKSALPFINCRKIKNVILVGEALDNTLIKKLMDLNITIHNEYGPSECTICSSYKRISKDVTIGKPIANTQIFIVDKYIMPTPVGVTGELCIAGDGVGAGYLKRPKLTAEKFIDNPFGKGKLYKTGDLAYWTENGDIMFVGRNDFQVKIRGLRIELGEIENAICSTNGVLQAVVVVRKDKRGRQFICAFYTEKYFVVVADIKKNISDKLPKYMVPHIFARLDELPLTSSGKINRKALPELDLEHITSVVKYVKPQTNIQKKLVNIMETVIGQSPIGLNDNFFDVGGDSLKAIEFVSEAHTEGFYFNVQSIYDNPTILRMCEYIENGNDKKVYVDGDFCDIHKSIVNNKISTNYVVCDSEIGNLFLTGATGYLGIHILADFLENEKGMVYCLIRGDDVEDSKNKLKKFLYFYFGGKYISLFSTRIIVMNGDLLTEHFGFDEICYHSISNKVQTVIHAAASVKHYGMYKYFYEINVEGTRKVIQFAMQAKAKLIHVSTLSISGNSLGDNFDTYRSLDEKFFHENDLFIGQSLDNVYIRSKFEAEKAVIEAIKEGLQANICRIGNLTNRYSDCKFQYNYETNAFVQRVKALLELGVFPDYLLPLYVEFTPIDDAAKAIIMIATHFNANYNVFHINNNKVVYFDKLLNYFKNIGIDMKIVSDKEFANQLRQMAEQTNTKYIFETFINDMTENEHLNYDSNIHILNDFTVDYLKALGFEWPDIDFDYVKRYVNYFKDIGYFLKDVDSEV